MNCEQLSILQITDGTTTVDLLDEHSGFLLQDWTPQVADFKDGGIFQNSPLATGRRLVAYRFANVTETMAVRSRHLSADALIRDTQTLRRLLQKAADYWATDWQNTPVYVKARGKGETNTRYCLIQQGRLGIDGNPYAQPFMQPSGSSVFEEQPLIFERGHWLSEVPGTTASVSQSGQQVWDTYEWSELTSTPSGEVTAITELSVGDNEGVLLAGTAANASVYRSTDGGTTWALADALSAAASDTVNVLFEYSNGYVFAGVSGTNPGAYRSTDGGQNFALVTPHATDPDDVYDMIATTYRASIYAVGQGSPSTFPFTWKTTDLGDAWSGGNIDAVAGAIVGIVEIPETGIRVMVYNDIIYKGGTVLTHGSSQFECLSRLSNGILLAGMLDGTVYQSLDDGDTWSAVSTTLTSGCFRIAEAADGTIYAGGDSKVWRSWNNGNTWIQVSTDPSIEVRGLTVLSDGRVLAGDDGQIWAQSHDTASVISQHVINSHPMASITNVKQYDDSATSYVDLYPSSSLPYNIIFGPPFSFSDAVYFGVNTQAGAFTFSNVVFNITTKGTYPNDIESWEYWDGSAWTEMDVVQNIRTSESLFGKLGEWSVTWDIPSDWAIATVDGVTGYWVRLTDVGGGTGYIVPQQGEQDIFFMRNAYVEIASSVVEGDLPALAQMEIDVASDADGPSGSAPDGYANRVIVGLRNVSRGSRFNAYLNASDQGNDPDILVSVGTDTTFVTDITYPTNRRATYSPASTGNWLDIVTWTILGDLVSQYYGTFHVFLRARQSGGSAGDIVLRMVTSTGSGGIEITTVSKEFENTNDYQFIDFGRVTLPVSSLQNDDEEGDEATITIQCNASSTTPDIYFMDLVLIPIDEWYGDFTDQQRNATSPLTGGYYLDVDSATFPKRSVRAQVRSDETDRIKNVFRPSTNGEFILQSNAQQRLWFFFARTASAGSPSIWYSQSNIAAKITLKANQRYLGMRGDR